MKSINYLIINIALIFMVINVATYAVSTIYHERAHREIAIHNGCSEYNIEYFPNPYFQCLNRSRIPTTEEMNNEYMLDSLNEIVGYNTSATWIAIISTGFAICLTMLYIYNDFKKDSDTP